MKEKRNKQKGITLIALIITIIVLLILAGVTIATLTGNHGILTQVDNAKTRTIESKVKEEIDLAVQSANLKIRTKTAENNSWNATTDENIGTVISALTADLKEDKGYTVTDKGLNAETGIRKISVVYSWKDYKNAKKDEKAKITKTLDVSQNKIVYGVCSHQWGEDEVCIVCGAKKLKIGAKINYHEYLNEAGTAFATMPSYTSKKEQTGHSEDQIFTVANNSGIEWIILGEENGQIKITTKNIVQPTSGGYTSGSFKLYRLSGQAGYKNFVNELNEISAIYGKGKYADVAKFEVTTGGATGGRSFIREDLGCGRLTRNGTAYTYALEKHEGDAEAKVYRYPAGTTPDGKSTTGGRYSTFVYTEQDASTSTEERSNTWNSLSEENKYVTIYPYKYSGGETLTTTVSKADTAYWLASQRVDLYNDYVNFGVHYVDNNGYGYGYIILYSIRLQ